MMRALADAAVIQDPRPHADNAHILDHAAVDGGIMADGDPVAHNDGIEVAMAVEHGAVLHVGAGADANRVDVAAQDGVHPHRGALAQDDVAEDLRGGIDVAIGGDLGRMALEASNHGDLFGGLF